MKHTKTSKIIYNEVSKMSKLEMNLYMYILPIKNQCKLDFLNSSKNIKSAIKNMLFCYINKNKDIKRGKSIKYDISPIIDIKYINISKEYSKFFLNNKMGCIGYYMAKKHFPNSNIIALFYLGNLELLKKPKIGIIGARECLDYSSKITAKFAKNIVENNFVTVSGLALGIDTATHIFSKVDNVYKTIGILGTGFSKQAFYPKINYGVFKDIILNGGLVLSEYLPDYTGNKYTFPRRNRLIADLSNKLIVVEAKDKSGSMITVNYALNYGKDIYVVPGNIDDKRYSGSNNLIKDGANIITDKDDLEYIFEN